MNNTPHHVLDAWIAYEVFIMDQEAKAREKASGKGESMDVGTAFNQLEGMVGNGV